MVIKSNLYGLTLLFVLRAFTQIILYEREPWTSPSMRKFMLKSRTPLICFDQKI